MPFSCTFPLVPDMELWIYSPVMWSKFWEGCGSCWVRAGCIRVKNPVVVLFVQSEQALFTARPDKAECAAESNRGRFRP